MDGEIMGQCGVVLCTHIAVCLLATSRGRGPGIWVFLSGPREHPHMSTSTKIVLATVGLSLVIGVAMVANLALV